MSAVLSHTVWQALRLLIPLFLQVNEWHFLHLPTTEIKWCRFHTWHYAILPHNRDHRLLWRHCTPCINRTLSFCLWQNWVGHSEVCCFSAFRVDNKYKPRLTFDLAFDVRTEKRQVRIFPVVSLWLHETYSVQQTLQAIRSCMRTPCCTFERIQWRRSWKARRPQERGRHGWTVWNRYYNVRHHSKTCRWTDIYLFISNPFCSPFADFLW